MHQFSKLATGERYPYAAPKGFPDKDKADIIFMRAENLHRNARSRWLEPITITHPDIAEEAHGWDPSQYTAGCSTKMDWKCKKCNHEWNAPISRRTLSNNGCPVCRVGKQSVHHKEPLSVTHPYLASEALGWDPSEWTAGSAKKQCWKCKDCGYEWEARISHRTIGRCRCKRCYGSWNASLSISHPEIAAQAYGWDPSTVTAGSGRRKKWFDEKCGHIWEDSVINRTSGSNCRVCIGLPSIKTNTYVEIEGQKARVVDLPRTLAFCYPEIAAQLVNPEYAKLVSKGSTISLEWECPYCQHCWWAVVNNRTTHGQGCPQCSKSGFDRVCSAYLYFVLGTREGFGLSEFGITKDLVARLKDHRSCGFTVNSGLPVCRFEVGRDAEVVETQIKRELRTRGVPSAKEDPLVRDRFAGWSESFRSELLPVADLGELLTVLGLGEIVVPHEWGVVPVLSARKLGESR